MHKIMQLQIKSLNYCYGMAVGARQICLSISEFLTYQSVEFTESRTFLLSSSSAGGSAFLP